MYSPANACLAKLPIHGAMGPRGGGGYLCPPANLVPIREQRIDERTLNFL